MIDEGQFILPHIMVFQSRVTDPLDIPVITSSSSFFLSAHSLGVKTGEPSGKEERNL